MAELSAETKAIIDRLKAEGDLIRNSGTNSVRSVKIQLDKFEGIFNTISANVIEQTKILQMQAGLAQENIEAQRTREQLDELKQEEEKKSRIDGDDSRRKTDENIDKIADSLRNAFSLKNIALAGAGLFVGYNLLKGFIDDTTNGGFSALEDSIATTDWNAIGQSATDFVTGINSIDWNSLSTAVNIASSAINNFGDWMDDILPGILVGGILGSIARGSIRGGIEGLISGAGRRDPSDARLISTAHRTAIRAGIAGIVATGVLVFGDQVRDWVNRQSWSDNEIAGARVGDVVSGGIDVLGAAAQGAALGSFFGPGGALAGAILGGSVALGVQLYNWYDRRRTERAAQLAADMAAADRLLETRQEEFEDLATRLSTMTPQQQEDAMAGMSGPEVIATNRMITPLMDAIEELTYQRYESEQRRLSNPAGIQDLTSVRSAETNLESFLSSGENRQEVIDALLAARNTLLSEISSMVDPETGSLVAGTDRIRYEAMQANADYLERLLTAYGGRTIAVEAGRAYRTGTRGFEDFGAGQYAVLHGREAVVPFNTAAGRFLDQYFTENWEPKKIGRAHV